MLSVKLDTMRIERVLRLLATNPQTVGYFAREALWSARPSSMHSLPLSWTLPSKTLPKTTILWPTPVPLSDAGGWVATVHAALAEHVKMTPMTIDHPFTSILFFEVVVR